jgi:hypothetical protein
MALFLQRRGLALAIGQSAMMTQIQNKTSQCGTCNSPPLYHMPRQRKLAGLVSRSSS